MDTWVNYEIVSTIELIFTDISLAISAVLGFG